MASDGDSITGSSDVRAPSLVLGVQEDATHTLNEKIELALSDAERRTVYRDRQLSLIRNLPEF